ncbi:MAG TPA: hypothetical protein VFX95_07045 [Caulobacteraceae bacterium]|nr:hypothetical protein [Caulobacteraceae bacterium]
MPLTPPLAPVPDRPAAPSLAQPEPEEPEEAEEAEEAAVPPAAMVDRGAEEAPRRGWWSRFVRKDD